MAAAGRLTDQQEKAVTTRQVSVALSAGAGCGKTFVLTERFLACLEPDAPGGPARLDELTAITFTERAAREMRDRIRAACTRRLMEAAEHQADHWLRLIRDLDAARISTIHSFCGSLLRNCAVEAGLDPRFQVLDQAQADTLLYELIDQELRDRLTEREEAVIELLVQFNLDSLRDMVRKLLGMRQEIAWDQWRGETVEGLLERWEDFWRSDTRPRVLARVSGSAAARALVELARQKPSTNGTMQERCAVLLEQLPALADARDPAAALEAIREAARVQGGGSKKAWTSEEVYDKFRDAAKEVRDEIDRVGDRLAFDVEAARPAAEAALRLLALADGVCRAYEARKRELAALDFNDLLIRARDLLTGPKSGPLRKRLAAQTKLLLVDEFQDTDPVQVGLVKALCDDHFLDGRLFFVGDYKQSIYRFRGADPHVFRRLREEIPDEGRLPLSLNFRSQPAVLDFVNALFCEEMGPEYEPLRPHRTQVGPKPAVEFLWAIEAEDNCGAVVPAAEAEGKGLVSSESVSDSPSPQPSPGGRGEGNEEAETELPGSPTERRRRREADWIARRIRGLLDSGEKLVWDHAAAEAGTPAARAVRAGDIAILFRALTDVQYYEEALRRYEINYYLVGGHAFYAQQEICDVVNLLRTLASPCDAVSLAGVLRSGFFGLWDETLFWLSRHAEGLSAGLFARPAALMAELDGQQRQRVEMAARTLAELRAIKDRVPIAQLFHEALARTGYDAALVAEFLGERKLANLHKLIEQARAFDQSGIFTLADFITQLSQFIVRQPDEPLAAICPETINAVRLMSVHQSKGLEFPVVVVPDVDRPRRGRADQVAFTERLGPMVKYPDVTSGYDLFMLAENDEDLAEAVRLLYVATTRPADYLILSAGLDELGEAKGPWMDLIGRRFDVATGQLLPSLACGRGESSALARVTVTEPPLPAKSTTGAARSDLLKLVEQAEVMAGRGAGRIPPHLAAIPPDLAARRQYSFSRLSGMLHQRPVAQLVSSVDGEAAPPAIDPLGLGTLVHAALADVVQGHAADAAALVRRHAPRHLPGGGEGPGEAAEMIARFLASSRGAALTAAAEAHAELEFLLAWPPGCKEPEAPYLQGFLDCLYRDAAGLHLVDFKTNHITAENLAAVAAGYEMQMLVYALAIERIWGRGPDEIVLCFLRPALEHPFAWNDAARARVVELVERAMRAAQGSQEPGVRSQKS